MLGKMKHHHKLTVTLCLIWAATILYGEMFAFWLPPLFTCSWPHHHLLKTNGVESNKFTKVAIVTDPQLMDKTSFRLSSKTLALEVAQFYTDINMRRSFFQSILPFKPDAVLFLGDYFDGGPYIPEDEWQESLSRFEHVFGLNSQGKVMDIPTFYITGNHDVGYSRVASHKGDVIDRYEKVFGIRNRRFMIGGVEFISIDAQAIDGNPQKGLATEVWKFVQNVSNDATSHPRVLLTHIPLYRPDQTPCGPHRSNPVIDQRFWRHFQDQEVIYQNYITQESSKKLLELINPVLVLSGHDHDQCTVTHKSKTGSVTEHTLGTISWQQGNIYPSFMLLSVPNAVHENSSDAKMLHTQLCFLPCQLFIYMWYLSLFVLSILSLLLWPNHGISFVNNAAGWISNVMKLRFLSGVTKEKNEDENCEYEMIWDAEGSMHLVKKVLETPVKRQNDKALVERGNAVMRAAARKNAGEQIELVMDSNAGAGGSDSLIRAAPRSRTKLVIQRVIRTIMMIIVIAAFNVPIYMMLLFKDWIEQ
uniref:Calcineurin-like phosphoesterase domain-containing protein n=1 Tax=Noccaea caerulescens TaxID=107243 RepID=A0A1J3IGF6_NOCCA